MAASVCTWTHYSHIFRTNRMAIIWTIQSEIKIDFKYSKYWYKRGKLLIKSGAQYSHFNALICPTPSNISSSLFYLNEIELFLFLTFKETSNHNYLIYCYRIDIVIKSPTMNLKYHLIRQQALWYFDAWYTHSEPFRDQSFVGLHTIHSKQIFSHTNQSESEVTLYWT